MPIVQYNLTPPVLSVGPPQSLTLGAILSLVQDYLMNTSSDVNSLSWPVSELTEYANEAVFYIQQLGQFIMDEQVLDVTANQSTYNTPANIYQLIRTTFDRVNTPQTNEYELDRDVPAWRTSPTGIPRHFYMPQFNEVAPFPIPAVSGTVYQHSQEVGVVIQVTLADGITPDPQYTFNSELGIITGFTDTNGSIIRFKADELNYLLSTELGLLIGYATDEGNVSVIYAAQPRQLVLNDDVPQLPQYTHFAIVPYVVMRCFARDGEFQDLNLAQAWFAVFTDWMDASMAMFYKEWPTRVRTLEPYEAGNIFAARLRDVGFPGLLQTFGPA